MKYVIIPFVVAVVIFFAKVCRDVAKKLSEGKKFRKELFAHIGKEWLKKITEELKVDIVRMQADKQIRGKFYKEKNSWLIAIPLRDYREGIDFELIVGVGPLIPLPEPHIKTLLMDMIIVTDKKKRWWASNCNTKIFDFVTQKLSREGLIFPIDDTDAIS